MSREKRTVSKSKRDWNWLHSILHKSHVPAKWEDASPRPDWSEPCPFESPVVTFKLGLSAVLVGEYQIDWHLSFVAMPCLFARRIVQMCCTTFTWSGTFTQSGNFGLYQRGASQKVFNTPLPLAATSSWRIVQQQLCLFFLGPTTTVDAKEEVFLQRRTVPQDPPDKLLGPYKEVRKQRWQQEPEPAGGVIPDDAGSDNDDENNTD